MRVYLDSCIAIYLIEGDDETRRKISQQFEGEVNVKYCVSPLVRLECLTGAYAACDDYLVSRYRAFFNKSEMIEIDEDVWERATRVRAETKMKLPDAIHLAAAENSGCDCFWTVDRHFRTIGMQPMIKIILTRF